MIGDSLTFELMFGAFSGKRCSFNKNRNKVKTKRQQLDDLAEDCIILQGLHSGHKNDKFIY